MLNSFVDDAELRDLDLCNVCRIDRNFTYTVTSKGGRVLLARKKSIEMLSIDIFIERGSFYVMRSIDNLVWRLKSNNIVRYFVILHASPVIFAFTIMKSYLIHRNL